MPNPSCFASMQAVSIRVAELTSVGAPSAGSTNGYVSNAIVSLQASVELNTGDEFTGKNGVGGICQYFKNCDTIKSLTLTMNLCQLDSTLISYMTGATLFSSGGNAIGFEYGSVQTTCPNPVSLEIWTKAWDGTQQALPTFTTPNGAYWHWVFPNTTWQIGNIQMENALMVVPLTGHGYENANITANGPFNDWPTAVANAGGVTRVGGVFLDGTLPTAGCAPIAVPSGS